MRLPEGVAVHEWLIRRRRIDPTVGGLGNDGTWSPCWLWTGSKSHGYGYVYVGTSREDRWARVHRLMALSVFGPSDLFVCHRCDVRACFNPEHLFFATHQDNMADAVQKGRTASGERHERAKLTVAAVREMRQLYASGSGSQRALARRFGVSLRTAQQALIGETWTAAS